MTILASNLAFMRISSILNLLLQADTMVCLKGCNPHMQIAIFIVPMKLRNKTVQVSFCDSSQVLGIEKLRPCSLQ